MNVLQEIRNLFAEVYNSKAVLLETISEEEPTWVIRKNDWYGVGIINKKNIEISERFSNVRLWNEYLIVDGLEQHMLLLTSNIENLRNEFANVCANFVALGKENIERNRIYESPFSWWEKWKVLLGNSVQNKSSYSVLGEMIVFYELRKKSNYVKWSALESSTHDIDAESGSYEVKSTIKRYESSITINSQYQLKSHGKILKVIFCRLESSPQGVSIDDMLEKLVDLGIDSVQVNKSLEKMGYEKGSHLRRERYKVHEIREYIVDEDFPKITRESFKDNIIPESIVKIVYEIDLNGISHKSFDYNFI